jgi:integrase
MPLALADLLRVHKTRILERALAFGREYCRDPLMCFPGFGGSPMDPQRLTIRLRRLMHKAGIKGRSPCHASRHFSATTLLHATGNLKIVQVRLGHVSAAFTMATYVHAVEKQDREAADHLGTILTRKTHGERDHNGVTGLRM